MQGGLPDGWKPWNRVERLELISIRYEDVAKGRITSGEAVEDRISARVDFMEDFERHVESIASGDVGVRLKTGQGLKQTLEASLDRAGSVEIDDEVSEGVGGPTAGIAKVAVAAKGEAILAPQLPKVSRSSKGAPVGSRGGRWKFATTLVA